LGRGIKTMKNAKIQQGGFYLATRRGRPLLLRADRPAYSSRGWWAEDGLTGRRDVYHAFRRQLTAEEQAMVPALRRYHEEVLRARRAARAAGWEVSDYRPWWSGAFWARRSDSRGFTQALVLVRYSARGLFVDRRLCRTAEEVLQALEQAAAIQALEQQQQGQEGAAL
jgi:hypothetical protein